MKKKSSILFFTYDCLNDPLGQSQILPYLEDKWFDSSIGDKISVIPTCADLSHFSPANIKLSQTDDLRNKLNIQKDDFVLLYLGSLGTWYMLEEMLDFYEELKVELKNFTNYISG